MTVPVKEVVQTVATAVLSTTAKATARAKEKKKFEFAESGEDAKMDTDDKPAAAGATEDAPMDTTDATATATDASKPAAPKEKEPTSETLQNMTRVTPAQSTTISFPTTARYQPVRDLALAASATAVNGASKKAAASAGKKGKGGGGILMVLDTQEGGAAGEKDFIELEKSLDEVGPAVVEPAAGGDVEMGEGAAAPAASAPVEDGPERDTPGSFEYPFSRE